MVFFRGCCCLQPVVAGAAFDVAAFRAAVDRVVAVAAPQRAVAGPAVYPVVAGGAVDAIPAVAAVDGVVVRSADDRVVAGAALDERTRHEKSRELESGMTIGETAAGVDGYSGLGRRRVGSQSGAADPT